MSAFSEKNCWMSTLKCWNFRDELVSRDTSAVHNESPDCIGAVK